MIVVFIMFVVTLFVSLVWVHLIDNQKDYFTDENDNFLKPFTNDKKNECRSRQRSKASN